MFLDDLVTSLHAGIGRYPEALAYLQSRRVTAEDVRDFRLGFGKVVPAGPEGDPEGDRFNKETFRGRQLEGRIILPIEDAIGRVVGLAGRTIEGKAFKTFVTEEAKYTGFFFGLRQALPHIMRENRVFVVEGYFDLLAFRKVFPNAVASITSGINEPQHDQLAMYCDNITVCFDSDEPGIEGRDKALAAWRDVGSVSIGEFKDPAVILEKKGLDWFRRYIQRVVKDGVLL